MNIQTVEIEDKAVQNREPTGTIKTFLTVISVCFVLFHIYTAYAGPLPNLQQRAVHVGFALFLTFAMFKPFALRRGCGLNRISLFLDIGLVVLTIMFCSYVVINYHWIMENPAESTKISLWLGSIGILLVLEAGRRTVGILFPILTIIFILYALIGQYIPDIPIVGKYLEYWGHRGFSFRHVIQVMYLSDQGLWGFVTGISSTLVAVFIIFGGFLLATGAGEHFIDTAVWTTGRFYGGGAKVSIVASGFFGMLSGSAVANVATTGNFTIPLMKRLKYGNEFSGAVEATASAGGQITPPIMGAGAFLMAELLEMPYIQVAVCAVIPAFLYYLSILSAVYFESLKRGFGRVPEEDIKTFREIIRPSKSIPLFIPIIILVALMLSGRTPETSAFWAIFAFTVLFIFATLAPVEIRQRFIKLYSGISRIGLSLVKVVPLLVCANVIVSLISLTGIGVNASELIMSISGQSVILALLLAALVTLMLGMGIPTPAAYLLGASVLAPSLVSLGYHPVACHMFIFYFAILSALTPPVCAGVYVAAGIAGGDWIKTAWLAIRLGLITYILPFIFLTNISLLSLGTTWQVLWAVLTASIGAVMISGGTMGYFFGKPGIAIRLLLVLAAVLCFKYSYLYSFTGIGMGLCIVFYQKWKKGLPYKAREQPI